MKKSFIFVILILIALIAAFFIYQGEIVWKIAEASNNETFYNAYISQYPGGEHISEAKEILEELAFKKVNQTNDIYIVNNYIEKYPQGKHIEAIKTLKDSLLWQEALDKNNFQTVEEFINKYPESSYITQAKEKLIELKWDSIKNTNDIDKLDKFIKENPESKFISDANEKKAELNWKKVAQRNTIKDIQLFLKDFPQSKYTKEANELINKLKIDDKPYQIAQSQGSLEAYQRFIENYPGHKNYKEAMAVMTLLKGVDLYTLMKKGVINVSATGKSIKQLTVHVTNKLKTPIAVIIPVGTLFVAKNKAVQNMFTVYPNKITVAANSTTSIQVKVSCANRTRKIPGLSDEFTVIPRAPNPDLIKLSTVLNVHTPHDVAQAAIWIITDNATYEDLGILRTSSTYSIGSPGYRTIGAKETLEAIKLLDSAGINVRSKAIWKDVDKIKKELASYRH